MDKSASSRETQTRPAPRPAAAGDGRSRRASRQLTAALLALLTAVGVAVLLLRHDSVTTRLVPRATESPPPTETDAPFPSDTASDVVSYSDHVALVTAIAETDAPTTATPTTSPAAERMVMRSITFRVDDVLWSRPNARTAPTTLKTLWWGWLPRDGKRTPFIVSGAPAVFLGAQYVVPIAYDGGAFAVLQPYAGFRFNEGAVTPEEQDTPLARDLAFAARDEVAEMFATAVPGPLAERYGHLPPRARLAAVIAAQTRCAQVASSTPLQELPVRHDVGGFGRRQSGRSSDERPGEVGCEL